MKQPPVDQPSYGGGPPEQWGAWIKHDGGLRPQFVRADMALAGDAADPVDYVGINNLRGVGRNYSPDWESIRWFRLPAGHKYYAPPVLPIDGEPDAPA